MVAAVIAIKPITPNSKINFLILDLLNSESKYPMTQN
jgi:hypothetical protein